jgi:DNA-binding NtrC family response regulator
MQQHPVKILVVDDDSGVLALLKATLSTTKHQITYCSSAADAVKQLAHTSYDIILSDYMMPGMTGLELLSIATTSSPDATRFLLTAAATLDVAVEAMKSGGLDRLIRKPWGTASLLHAVEEAAYEHTVRRSQRSPTPVDAASPAAPPEGAAAAVTPALEAAHKRSESSPKILVRRTDVEPQTAIEMLNDYF